MAKSAHIITRPASTKIGERALAVCGKEFKYKVAWEDLPHDKAICRDCVDTLLVAAKEADVLIVGLRGLIPAMQTRLIMVSELLHPEDDLYLDQIEERTVEFLAAKREAEENKAIEERAQTTCICRWREAGLIEAVNEDCPIHGGTEAVAKQDEADEQE